MPKFYPSISDDLRDWVLRQSVFFVASAPLQGRHINLSPKGLPDASLAILGPNEAAYIDATGSGSETISHVRENGRITVMFCSFDTAPGIVRFFCNGSVIEWDQPEFPQYLDRMGGKAVVGARAIIHLDVFKVQSSCGYGVPRLSVKLDPDTNESKPYLKDRDTLGHWAGKQVQANKMRAYQKEWNYRSLDGLPALWTAVRDNNKFTGVAQLGNWARRHRDDIETAKTIVLVLFMAIGIMHWIGYVVGASGSASDRHYAIAEFARSYPRDPVDVITADFLSEANMTAGAARRVDQIRARYEQVQPGRGSATTRPAHAYEASFLLALEPALMDLAKHRIKLAVNAGNADTEGLHDAVVQMVQAKGLDLKVAWISGDQVLSTVQEALSSGKSDFKSIYTGQPLSEWPFEPIFAQCYLGGLGIAAALANGADIVLCGRVSDASAVIGAAYWFHGWQRSDLDRLANALVAGHLIECSNYVCGGNFTGFKMLESLGGDGWTNIGYPIAEISPEGQVIITMQTYATGGAVTVDTCSAQLLYEIQGPRYLNSDVTALLGDISFEQRGTNRVALRGVRSAPPPPTTKVGISARGGFQAEAVYFLVGLDIAAKARMLEAQIRHVLAPYSDAFTALTFSTLGSAPDDPRTQDSATVTFRIVAQARTAAALAPPRFLRPITDNIMQGYPGATWHLDTRQGFPRPIFEYFVCLLPQTAVQHRLHLPWKTGATNAGPQTVDIAPPPAAQADLTPAPPIPTPIPSTTNYGPTIRGPLGWIVHARSGDKGPDANCGFWVRHADEFQWLRRVLTVSTVQELLGPQYTSTDTDTDTAAAGAASLRVERFELPNLRAVHFLFRNLLDRGVCATVTVDFLGKNVAEFLRARFVDLPVRFLERGKL
ncbi:hypothetical protein ASPACDRAFT_49109 [Aspergillus aculeatus ATCC 16872]|uniref:Uncharacterized protein n=1 Tax=Aspergillus aculeatus (strain ATCC 16872 / CBS 172.66 / WB 5094) TaxID=690307 RepID=A0A1L9X8N7_ASPA1|nr:uncharacterized protein ASPACDRAFT_49109 [Aspergillus aculeatus ATCC 16872]OJK04704.1 hypothetical protein ASPACDRAFT_49109 [Aspergillus aculeatus ATCC 16872]